MNDDSIVFAEQGNEKGPYRSYEGPAEIIKCKSQPTSLTSRDDQRTQDPDTIDSLHTPLEYAVTIINLTARSSTLINHGCFILSETIIICTIKYSENNHT